MRLVFFALKVRWYNEEAIRNTSTQGSALTHFQYRLKIRKKIRTHEPQEP